MLDWILGGSSAGLPLPWQRMVSSPVGQLGPPGPVAAVTEFRLSRTGRAASVLVAGMRAALGEALYWQAARSSIDRSPRRAREA